MRGDDDIKEAEDVMDSDDEEEDDSSEDETDRKKKQDRRKACLPTHPPRPLLVSFVRARSL